LEPARKLRNACKVAEIGETATQEAITSRRTLLFWAAIWIGRGYIVRNRSSICQREGTTMSKHRAPSKERLAGALLLGAAASGALAIASLSGAGAANATCASISGVGNGNGCTSTATNFAVGLGPNTTATAANGVFNGARP
jgi:hypothetical protein